MQKRQYDFINKANFKVVEKSTLDPKQGNLTLFPHTDQLPKLWEAINQDFRKPLAGKFAIATPASADHIKYAFLLAAQGYCALHNQSRSDKIVLRALPDQNRVTQICIAQQITRLTQSGNVHYFKFYGGAHFQTEIRANGKRIFMASHLIDRVQQRIPTNPGDHLASLFESLFNFPWFTAMVNNSQMLISSLETTFHALPYEESDDEILLKSCLSVKQIDSFTPITTPRVYDLHYSDTYTPPGLRYWNLDKIQEERIIQWRSRSYAPPAIKPLESTWEASVKKLAKKLDRLGVKKGLELIFFDNIAGPNLALRQPDEFKNILDAVMGIV